MPRMLHSFICRCLDFSWSWVLRRLLFVCFVCSVHVRFLIWWPTFPEIKQFSTLWQWSTTYSRLWLTTASSWYFLFLLHGRFSFWHLLWQTFNLLSEKWWNLNFSNLGSRMSYWWCLLLIWVTACEYTIQPATRINSVWLLFIDKHRHNEYW